jgi:hypothetical protein
MTQRNIEETRTKQLTLQQRRMLRLEAQRLKRKVTYTFIVGVLLCVCFIAAGLIGFDPLRDLPFTDAIFSLLVPYAWLFASFIAAAWWGERSLDKLDGLFARLRIVDAELS